MTHTPAGMPSPQRRLVLTLDGVPTIGRPLVGAGRIWLVELSDDLPSTAPEEHAATPTPTPTATAWVWAPGEPLPRGIPELSKQEADFVSAAALVAPSGRARPLDGVNWDDPKAEPPDRPRPHRA